MAQNIAMSKASARYCLHWATIHKFANSS